MRRTVLDASRTLLEEEGLRALSMREVARRTGVSHQAPYHYFRDREGILAALSEEQMQRLYEAMVEAVARARTPTKRLEAVGRCYIEFALANPALFKMMHQSEHVPFADHEGIQKETQKVFDLLVSLVRAAAGARSEREIYNLVLTAWSLVHGVSMLMLENRLQRKFPAAYDKPDAIIDSVLKTFSGLFD